MEKRNYLVLFMLLGLMVALSGLAIIACGDDTATTMTTTPVTTTRAMTTRPMTTRPTTTRGMTTTMTGIRPSPVCHFSIRSPNGRSWNSSSRPR